ncbi:MAG: PAS domain S-box protein [Chitinophagaceae bacterium]|nr:PAS domain S-box protein [Chitinophagaceae bacterium]
MILHAVSRDEIFSEICTLAVTVGRFAFAWIGVENGLTATIEPINQTGKDYTNFKLRSTAVKTAAAVNTPTVEALRYGTCYVRQSVAQDPFLETWSKNTDIKESLSAIALPVKDGNTIIGILTFYASKPFFFSEIRQALLERLAVNISYAIHTLSTELKRKATDLQLQKITMAVEQSSASIVITDLKGDIEYVNPAFTKLTGYTFEEVRGQNPRILKSGYTSAAEYELIWQKLFKNEVWRGEFHNKKKNGELYWENVSISPISNSQNEITHFVAVKENITEKKLAEEALRQSEKQFKSLIENINIGILKMGTHAEIIISNNSALKCWV